MRVLVALILVLGMALPAGADEGPPVPAMRLAGQRTRIRALAYSADGKLAVAAGGDQTSLLGLSGRLVYVDCTARIWNLATGRLLATLQGHQRQVTGVELSRDGRRLVSWDDEKKVRVWEVSSGKQLHVFEGTRSRFSPDGRLLAVVSEGAIRLLDVASGEEVQRCVGHPVGTTAIAFSPDGQMLVSGGEDGAVRICAVRTGKAVRSWAGQGWPPAVLSFVDEKRIGCASLDGSARMLDAQTGQVLATLKLEVGEENILELALDGERVYALTPGAAIRAWSFSTGKPAGTRELPQVTAQHFAVAPGGKQLLVSTLRTTDVLVYPGPEAP